MKNDRRNIALAWFARIAVGLVFVLNISCALSFILHPEGYAWSFEVSGVSGKTVVEGLGILFLMWNATYPPVLINPRAQKTLFAVILVQQFIGVVGETWMALTLPAGHVALLQTGERFILFDAGGLVLMGIAFLLLFRGNIKVE